MRLAGWRKLLSPFSLLPLVRFQKAYVLVNTMCAICEKCLLPGQKIVGIENCDRCKARARNELVDFQMMYSKRWWHEQEPVLSPLRGVWKAY